MAYDKGERDGQRLREEYGKSQSRLSDACNVSGLRNPYDYVEEADMYEAYEDGLGSGWFS